MFAKPIQKGLAREGGSGDDGDSASEGGVGGGLTVKPGPVNMWECGLGAGVRGCVPAILVGSRCLHFPQVFAGYLLGAGAIMIVTLLTCHLPAMRYVP